jgi:glutathione S-transferase
VRNSNSHGQNMDEFPNVSRWIAEIGQRPAVRRGLKALEKA